MKKTIKTTLGIIAILSLSLVFSQCKEAKDAVITKFLEAQAEALNATCPREMGNGLTFTKCTVEENKTLKYTFTIADEVSGFITINDQMKVMAVHTIKAMPEFEQIKEYEASFIFAYYDTKEKLLGEIKITPEDYNKAETEEIDMADQMIKTVVASISPNLPMKVDETTSIIGVNELPNKSLEYIYEVNLPKNIPNLEETLKGTLVQLAQTNPEIKKMIDAGVTLVYVYKDKSGKELCRIDLSSDDI